MRSWIGPAALVIAVEYAVAIGIGVAVGFHYSIPVASYALVGASVTVVSFAGLMVVRFVKALSLGDAPPDLSRFYSFASGVMLVTLQMAVLTWMKVMLPLASPFWADPLLARFDRAIFFGEPWRLSHSLLGDAKWIDAVYVTWAPVKMVVLVALLLMPESPRKARAMLSYFLVFACGVFGQYALSSAGPIFYERLGLGTDFTPLPVLPLVQAAADYLWQDYLAPGGRIGAGISAMPSMHVALALWAALVFRSYLPRFQVFAWVWFAGIFIGSIHLGWHYAVDGIVAIFLTVIVWCFLDRARGIEWPNKRIGTCELQPSPPLI